MDTVKWKTLQWPRDEVQWRWSDAAAETNMSNKARNQTCKQCCSARHIAPLDANWCPVERTRWHCGLVKHTEASPGRRRSTINMITWPKESPSVNIWYLSDTHARSWWWCGFNKLSSRREAEKPYDDPQYVSKKVKVFVYNVIVYTSKVLRYDRCFTSDRSCICNQTRVIPVFTPKPQSLTALWPVLIAPTHG